MCTQDQGGLHSSSICQLVVFRFAVVVWWFNPLSFWSIMVDANNNHNPGARLWCWHWLVCQLPTDNPRWLRICVFMSVSWDANVECLVDLQKQHLLWTPQTAPETRGNLWSRTLHWIWFVALTTFFMMIDRLLSPRWHCGLFSSKESDTERTFWSTNIDQSAVSHINCCNTHIYALISCVGSNCGTFSHTEQQHSQEDKSTFIHLVADAKGVFSTLESVWW